jgi:hypothetical protein
MLCAVEEISDYTVIIGTSPQQCTIQETDVGLHINIRRSYVCKDNCAVVSQQEAVRYSIPLAGSTAGLDILIQLQTVPVCLYTLYIHSHPTYIVPFVLVVYSTYICMWLNNR